MKGMQYVVMLSALSLALAACKQQAEPVQATPEPAPVANASDAPVLAQDPPAPQSVSVQPDALLSGQDQQASITQFLAVQEAVRNRDAAALLAHVQPSAVYSGYLLMSEDSADECDTTMAQTPIDEALIGRCPAIWDNLADLSAIKVDPGRPSPWMEKTPETGDSCATERAARFTTAKDMRSDEITPVDPGILVWYSEHSDKPDFDGCVVSHHYLFRYADGNLVLTEVSKLP